MGGSGAKFVGQLGSSVEPCKDRKTDQGHRARAVIFQFGIDGSGFSILWIIVHYLLHPVHSYITQHTITLPEYHISSKSSRTTALRTNQTGGLYNKQRRGGIKIVY